MNTELLLEAFGEVDEKLVLDADEYVSTRRKTVLKRIFMGMAAALLLGALSLGTAIAVNPPLRDGLYQMFGRNPTAEQEETYNFVEAAQEYLYGELGMSRSEATIWSRSYSEADGSFAALVRYYDPDAPFPDIINLVEDRADVYCIRKTGDGFETVFSTGIGVPDEYGVNIEVHKAGGQTLICGWCGDGIIKYEEEGSFFNLCLADGSKISIPMKCGEPFFKLLDGSEEIVDIELETDGGAVTFSELYGGEEWRKTP